MKKIGKKSVYQSHYIMDESGNYIPRPPIHNLQKNLKPGVYTLQADMEKGLFFKPKEVNFEDLVVLPGMPTDKILAEMRNFWSEETRAKYKRLNLAYKRGILLYGDPGVGKTACVVSAAEEFVQQGGVVIFNPNIQYLVAAVEMAREIEGPDLKFLIVFEEFDEVVDDALILSLLDGELQIENVVYLATTNYLNKIPKRLSHRPSRFAKRIKIALPTAEDRKIYLLAKTKDEAFSIEVAGKTDGMVIDQVKDIVISTQVFDLTIDNAIEKAKHYNPQEELVALDLKKDRINYELVQAVKSNQRGDINVEFA